MVDSLDMKMKEQRAIGMKEHRTKGDSGDTSALKELHICGYTTTPTPSSGWVVGVIRLPNHILIHGLSLRYASKNYLPLCKSPYNPSHTMLISPSSLYNSHNPTPDPVPAPVHLYTHYPLSATYPIHTVPSPHPPPLAPQSPQVAPR